MGWVNFPSHTATLVVKAGFRIVPGGVCEPLDEQSLEGDVMSKAQEPECLYDADMAQFKPKADLLLTGTCHTPGGKALTATTATFRVGDSVLPAILAQTLGLRDLHYYVDQFGGGSVSHSIIGQAALAVHAGLRPCAGAEQLLELGLGPLLGRERGQLLQQQSAGPG